MKAIMEVHHAETGETKEPTSMGGGPYARAVPNTVAIGTAGRRGPAHEHDERLKIDHLQDEPHLCSLAVASGRCCEDG